MTVIANTDLTTQIVGGTGLFDELMDSVSSQLSSQYDKGSITGSDFATVYLGSMQSVLQQSVAFLLSKEKAGLEADLIAQQILVAEQEVLNAQKQNELLDQQILNMQQEVLLNTAKVANTEADTINTTAKKVVIDNEALTIAAKTALMTVQTTNANKEGALIDQQILVATEQVGKTAQEKLNLASGKLKIEAETSLVVQNRTNAVTNNTTLVRQQEKLVAEKGLLAQKTVTETAQTVTGATSGVVGAQTALYNKQTDGFDRDAEQKAAQIYKDIWVVQRTTDNATVADNTNSLANTDIASVMDVLKAGVNAA